MPMVVKVRCVGNSLGLHLAESFTVTRTILNDTTKAYPEFVEYAVDRLLAIIENDGG